MKRKISLVISLLIAALAPAAVAQVPLVGSSLSVNNVPSTAGTAAGYFGYGNGGTGDADVIAANNGSSPSINFYFLLGTTLTKELSINTNGNLISPNGIQGSNVTATSTYTVPRYTVGTLPSAAVAGTGGMALVTDASSATVGSTCAGGGSTLMIAISTGSVWTCH